MLSAAKEQNQMLNLFIETIPKTRKLLRETDLIIKKMCLLVFHCFDFDIKFRQLKCT